MDTTDREGATARRLGYSVMSIPLFRPEFLVLPDVEYHKERSIAWLPGIPGST